MLASDSEGDSVADNAGEFHIPRFGLLLIAISCFHWLRSHRDCTLLHLTAMPNQEKSAEKSSSPERLKRLRLKTQKNWAEIAKMLAISESMIYQVVRGDRALSDKATWRLEALEANCGLLWQDLETKSSTDKFVRSWIASACRELEPPEMAFFLTAVTRVASEEMQRFLENHQLRLEQKEVIQPNEFDLSVTHVSEQEIIINTAPKDLKPKSKIPPETGAPSK